MTLTRWVQELGFGSIIALRTMLRFVFRDRKVWREYCTTYTSDLEELVFDKQFLNKTRTSSTKTSLMCTTCYD